ncbi:hypothetical protein NIES4075_67910 [Tolypothrix sp. NIES-4075]|uniref:hypothetical protein n=1 Tax=Tolypothrix sp. NIES-4075 TaxID=2005459 RepID=UPI000B5CA566|nr:hypothetical protein [Tolypothrix sp. NIES-4075]GAX45770.1 hypothetical protein NIES4075_67910 [Tolypothrix sp. NIES-4075]
MQATINYLNCLITVDLPNPEEDNTVKVFVKRLPGTYDKNLYYAGLTNFQFSAESENPNDWILEALKHAIASIEYYVTPYAVSELPAIIKTEIDESSEEEYENFPF